MLNSQKKHWTFFYKYFIMMKYRGRMGNCPPEISKMIKIIYLGGKIIMVDFKFKKSGLFAAGVLFGTAGIKILTSKDAKKLYTGCTAAVLRAKDCIMKTATSLQENAEDIYAEAKGINEERAAAEEAVEDVAENAEETADEDAFKEAAEETKEAATEETAE